MSQPRSMLVIDGTTARHLLPMDRCIDLMDEALAACARQRRRPAAHHAADAVPDARAVGAGQHAGRAGRSAGARASRSSPSSRATTAPATTRTRASSCCSSRSTEPGGAHRCDRDHRHPHRRGPAGWPRASSPGPMRTTWRSSARAPRRAPTWRPCVPCGRIRRVRAWSPHRRAARAFVDRVAADAGVTVEAVADARAAVEGADIVCTVTASLDAGARGCWLPGAHVNAVGSSQPRTASSTRRPCGARASSSTGASRPERGRRLPDPAAGGRHRRGPHPGRARRGRCRHGATDADAPRDHALRVARPGHRGPCRGPLDPPARARDRGRHPGPLG